MSAKLVTAYVELVPSMQGSESLIAKQLVPGAGKAGDRGGAAAGGGLMAGMRKALVPVAALMTGVFAVGSIVSWGGAQIDALANIERINAQTSAAITSTGGAAGVTTAHVEDLAGSLESLTAVEAEAIQSGANLLLTFTNIRNGVGEGNDIFDQAVAAMTDLSVAMGSDPQSAATMLGKALNDPIAGIAAMSRVGIQFTEDQKSMIAEMVAAGDIMGAQGIILNELNTQFGGSGAAFAETYAGKVQLIGHEWGTFGETIFGGVMPALTSLAGGLLNVLQWLNQVGVASSIGEALSSGLGSVGGVVESLTGALQSGGIAGFLGELSTLRASLFDTATTALPGLAQGLVAALPGVLSFITGTLVPQIVNEISTLLPLLITTISTLLPGLVDVFATAVPQMVGALTTLIPQVVGMIGTLVPQLLTTLVNMLPTLVMGAVTLFTGLVQALVTVLPTVITTLVGLIPTLVTTLLNALPLILSSAITLFVQIAMAILTALPQIITTLVGILPTLVTTLVGMIPTLLDTGISLFLQLVTAIGSALPSILTALVGILPSLVQAVVSLIPTLLTAAIDLFLAIVQGVPPAIPQIVQALVDMAPELVGALGDMVPQLLQAGKDLVGGVVDGLLQAGGRVGEVLLQIGQDAVGGFLDFFGIQSPSRLMASHSKWIPAGVAVGIEAGASDVEDAMSDLMAPVDAAASAAVTVATSGYEVSPAAAAALDAQSQRDQPIYTDSGVLLGVIRKVANGEARLVWTEGLAQESARVGAGVK